MTSIPARLAAATGPGPLLELEILVELGLVRRSQTPSGKWWLHCESPTFGWHGYCGNLDDWRDGNPPSDACYRVMSSIDAAVALVERLLPGWGYSTGKSPDGMSQAKLFPPLDRRPYTPIHKDRCDEHQALALLEVLFAALAKPGPGAVG